MTKCETCGCTWKADESEIHLSICGVVKRLQARVETLEKRLNNLDISGTVKDVLLGREP